MILTVWLATSQNWKEKSLVFISLGESKVLFSVCFLLSKEKENPS
jgi:hypothetical protein